MSRAQMSACPFEAANDLVYNRADFEAIIDIVYRESGNVLPDTKAMLVYSRLTRRLRICRLTSFADYIRRIKADAAERREAINLLTTNHTYFFREDHHFDHFQAAVRPGLIAKAQAGQSVRLWSAGCSSGEEVYSLSMVLLGADRALGMRLAQTDIAILASDLADHAVAAGIAASYDPAAVKPVPEPLRRTWIENADTAPRMADTIRKLVRFRRLNLLGPWPITRKFDVIFCRNVMIYFDEATNAALLERFAEQIAPGGYLYIGHSERMPGAAKQVFTPVGKTIYQRALS